MKVSILQLDTPLTSGRIYPEAEVQKAINEYNTRPNKLGEFDAGEEFNVKLDRVSHRTSDLYIENKEVFADIEVLDTPMGKILKDILASGVTLEFTSRATGNCEQPGIAGSPVSDYEIIAIDCITEKHKPTHPTHPRKRK
jgi:hypothetical protein